MLLAALAMALGTVMIRQVGKYADPVMATGWHMVLGGVPLLVASGLGESGQWLHLEGAAWLCLSYATLFGSAIAYGLFFFYAAQGNLTSLSSLTFLTPVFALIFGHWILGEVLSSLQFLGVCLTLVSIYLINQRQYLSRKLALPAKLKGVVSVFNPAATPRLDPTPQVVEVPVSVGESE